MPHYTRGRVSCGFRFDPARASTAGTTWSHLSPPLASRTLPNTAHAGPRAPEVIIVFLVFPMRFLKSLLDASFRRARRAEGKREYRKASELYLEADAPDDAARALLFHAATVDDSGERIRSYREALQWLPAESERSRQVEERLSRLLLREGEGAGPAQRQQWLSEAARRLNGLGQFEQAAQACLLLNDVEGAKEAMIAGGDIAALEALLEEDHQRTQAVREWERAFDAFETAVRFGARREAQRALRGAERWAQSVAQRDALSVQLQQFEDTVPRGQRVRMRWNGNIWVAVAGVELVLGRAGADLDLRDPSVSRRHLKLTRRGNGIELEDLASRHGVFVDDQQINQKLSQSGRFLCAISDETVVQVDPHEDGLDLEVTRGVDRGLRAILRRDEIPLPFGPGSIRFPEGWATLSAEPSVGVRLNGEPCRTEVELLVGDRLSFGPGEGDVLEILP